MNSRFFVIVATVVISSVMGAVAEPLWRAEGFEMPESVLYDKAHQRLIVSNIEGHPGAADGTGYLTLLSSDGVLLNRHWVRGLDAPKGMALIGDTLLVADLTKLHLIDTAAGQIKQSIAIEGAVFLNDVTTDGNSAWVTDLMTHTIWRYEDGAVSVWLQDEALQHPNGILHDRGRLLVGAWGEGIKEDFTTDTPGRLLTIDLETRKIASVTDELGNLDGIVRIGESIFVNDWIAGALFEVQADGSHALVMKHESGLADIFAHEQTLYLPLMLGGAVEAVHIDR